MASGDFLVSAVSGWDGVEEGTRENKVGKAKATKTNRRARYSDSERIRREEGPGFSLGGGSERSSV